MPARRRTGNGKSLVIRGASENNLKNIDVEIPLGVLHVPSPASPAAASPRLVNEVLYKTLAAANSTAPHVRPGRCRRHRRARERGQGHLHRPVAHRPHAALEPRDLHGRVQRHPRALCHHAGREAARLRPGALLLQHQGRPLRGLLRRRPHQDRDALPARRLRPLRRLQGQALQPRDAGGALQGQEHRRRAGHDRGGGAWISSRTCPRSATSYRRSTTSAWATSSSASRPRRSRAARRSA